MAGSVNKDLKSWYYVLEIGKVNGKRQQKKKRGFKTKKEAQIALREAENALSNGFSIEPSKVLYGEYLKDWIKHKKTLIKDSTLSTYTWLVSNYLIPVLGHHELSKLSPSHIQTLYNDLLLSNKLSRENLQKLNSLINDSLKMAERWGYINRNVASLVDRPKSIKKEILVWDINEIKTFLELAKHDRYYIAFLLALTTGMRQGEILGLRWKDVDLDKNYLSVTQTLDHRGKKLNAGAKTSSSIRSIALPPETIKALSKQKRVISKEKNYAGLLYSNHDLVVCTNIGTPCSPRNLLRTFYRLIEKGQLNKIRFHDLRHSHATMLLKQGVNPKIVAERLGHSNVRITLDTYSHVLPSMQVESASIINKLLF